MVRVTTSRRDPGHDIHRIRKEAFRVKLRTLIVAVALFAMALPATASAGKDKGKSDEVTVMSRNVYLGSDLTPAIGAPDLASAVDGAGQIYNEVVRTNFPERAVLLG